MSRSKAAKLLIEMGVPASVYDKDGEMALSLLVIKMPDVAMFALNQLHSEDRINHKKYFFLNYLEGTRVVDGRSAARTPMEAAVVSESADIIMHPVMQRLIETKWEKFGKRWAWFDFFVNTMSAITWTIMGVTLPLDNVELYNPLQKTWWRMVLACVALLLTIYEILKQIITTVRTKQSLTQWKNYRETSLSRDKPFCHPQWPDESRYVDSEIKRVREHRWLLSHDQWIYVDWTALFLIIAAAISHVVFFSHGSGNTHTVHVRIMCALLVVIWVRILKFVRPFEGTGAFVASFTKMLSDIFLSLFLIAIIFIPYLSSFWIVFGGLSPRPVEGYRNFPAVLYEVFMLTVLDSNHNIVPFIEIDPFMARILSGTYVFLSFVIILNLIIAMITDTFKRVFSYARVHAAMERAKTILNIENSLRAKSRNEHWDYMRLHCSPLVMDQMNRHGNKREELIDLTVCVKETHQLTEQRFGKRFGDKISTIEEIMKSAKDIVENYKESKAMLFTVFRHLKTLEDLTMAMETQPKQDTISEKQTNKTGNDSNDIFYETTKNTRKCTDDTKSTRNALDAVVGAVKRRKSTKSETGSRLMEKVKALSKSTGYISKQKKCKDDILRRKSVGGVEKFLKEKSLRKASRTLGDIAVKVRPNTRAEHDTEKLIRQVNRNGKEKDPKINRSSRGKTSKLSREMTYEEQDDKEYSRLLHDRPHPPLQDENLSDESLMSTNHSNSSLS